MTEGAVTTSSASSFPPANLPPSAQAWARAVAQRVAQLEDQGTQQGAKALELNKTLVQTLRRTRPGALVYKGNWLPPSTVTETITSQHTYFDWAFPDGQFPASPPWGWGENDGSWSNSIDPQYSVPYGPTHLPPGASVVSTPSGGRALRVEIVSVDIPYTNEYGTSQIPTGPLLYTPSIQSWPSLYPAGVQSLSNVRLDFDYRLGGLGPSTDGFFIGGSNVQAMDGSGFGRTSTGFWLDNGGIAGFGPQWSTQTPTDTFQHVSTLIQDWGGTWDGNHVNFDLFSQELGAWYEITNLHLTYDASVTTTTTTPGARYVAGDLVSRNGDLYLATQDVQVTTAPEQGAPWMPLGSSVASSFQGEWTP